MGGRRWTEAEDDLLRARYRDTLTAELARILNRRAKAVHHRANAMGLFKSMALISETARQRNIERNLRGLGNQGQFQPGLVPWNKGLSYHAAGRAVLTQFKPGNKPQTWRPVGSLRVVDGQLQCKVSDEPGHGHRRWKPVSRVVWEAAHGPVPPGHLVVFKPGRASIDPELITPDAVELITREEHVRRNSVHRLPPELREIHRLRARLTRLIREAERAASGAADTPGHASPATASSAAPSVPAGKHTHHHPTDTITP